jgi:hypothetical protein
MYCSWSPGDTASSDLTNTSTRLSGHWLVVVRVLWVAIAFVTLSLFFIAIPTRYKELQYTCTPGYCHLHAHHSGFVSGVALQYSERY